MPGQQLIRRLVLGWKCAELSRAWTWVGAWQKEYPVQVQMQKQEGVIRTKRSKITPPPHTHIDVHTVLVEDGASCVQLFTG